MNRLALAAVRQLLRFGEAATNDLDGFEHLRGLGVVSSSEDGRRAVATPGLVRMLRWLGEKEAEAGVFALYPEVQASWLGIVCARLEEIGIQRDLQALFEREMGTGVYRPTWLKAEKGSACVDVLAFVVDQNHPQYAGKLGTSEMVDRIVGAAGSYGSCRDYLAKTVVEMTRIGVPEPGFETLLERVDARLARISHQGAPNGDEGVEFKQGKRN